MRRFKPAKQTAGRRRPQATEYRRRWGVSTKWHGAAKTAAAWACYFRALKLGDAARVAAVDKLSVVMVAVVAALALNERLGLIGWIGVACAALGPFLISWAR